MFKDLDALKSSLNAATIKNHRPPLYLAEIAKKGKLPKSVITGNAMVFSP